MINNVNPSIKAQSLKETIAYSNMITRTYLKNKNSLRYDPLNTFKELKNIMEEKEQKIIKLSDKVKDFEIKLNTMELENKKLNNLLIHFAQERNKNMMIKSGGFHKSQNLRRATSALNLNNNKIKEKNIYTKIKYNKNNKNRPFSSLNNYKIKNIDNNDIIKMGNKSFDEVDTDILNKNKVNSKNNNNYYFKLKNYFINKNNFLNRQEMKDFKKIKESKNKNKILKIHNQQPLVKCINEFNQLINHTNRLFVYKNKITPKIRKKKLLNLPKKINLKKSKSMEEFKGENDKIITDDLNSQIIDKLTELIKELENQKSKARKNKNNINYSKITNKTVDKI